MNRSIICTVFLSAILILWGGSSATAQYRGPKLGYVFPAGGQQGTTFQVVVGGRQIHQSQEAMISGTGVQVRLIKAFPNIRINDGEENKVARKLLFDIISPPTEEEKNAPKPEPPKSPTDEPEEEVVLPTPEEVMAKHIFLDRLANPTPQDLELIYDWHFSIRAERKYVEPLNQCALLEITIEPDAPLGDRDLRLLGKQGLTPPIRFIVSNLPEIVEREPNDPGFRSETHVEVWNRRINDLPKTLLKQETYDIPAVFNGQVRSGDIDVFQFNAKKGQKLVMDLRGRYLIPYLADGVPGWFQPLLSLYNAKGKMLDQAMAYRHEPDPILFFEVPEDGVYALHVQDSIFRGRDDFVYRLSVAETPMLSAIFPLGVQQGQKCVAQLAGWNLSENTVTLDASELKPGIHWINRLADQTLPHPIPFAVDTLPEMTETEPNNRPDQAQTVSWPRIVNGRIDTAGDADCFAFKAEKGKKIVLNLRSRLLDRPTDALIRVYDPKQKLVARSDDRAGSAGPNIGLQTHHADPYLCFEPAEDGVYTVQIDELTRRGGDEYAYRLRISEPSPDFQVYCEPPSLFMHGKKQALKVFVISEDGFDEPIEMVPAEGEEFTVEKGRLEKGCREKSIDLVVPKEYDGNPREVRINAIAQINGVPITRPLIAMENMEQAFIYHHWVPAQNLVVAKPPK